MKYVVSDLYGEYTKFTEILDLINFSIPDELYILGDIIDRGNDSIKLLRFIMSQPNMHPVLGNHEDMMLQALAGDGFSYRCWLNNGGSND